MFILILIRPLFVYFMKLLRYAMGRYFLVEFVIRFRSSYVILGFYYKCKYFDLILIIKYFKINNIQVKLI
jgi:hypothetical protein